MSSAVKRACDACHRRKVKCDGISPCRNCGSAQLSCTYNAVPQKKGPKGSRAKVISELRENQRQASLLTRIRNRMTGFSNNVPKEADPFAPSAGMVTGEVIKACVEYYFSNVYTNMPILARHQLEQQLMFVERNRDVYCLVTALCAFVMLQPGMTVPATDAQDFHIGVDANIVANTLLLEEVLRVRAGSEYLDAPTFNSVATSYLLFACHAGIESHGKAWYYLREASTMMHMMGMHEEATYLQWDQVESARRRRLYWLVLASERGYALQRKRPITLEATIELPTMADDPTDPLAQELTPFLSLVTAFRHFDHALVSAWNGTSASTSASYAGGLEKQLNDELPNYFCQDPQFSDMSVNQDWLKHMTWELSNGVDNIELRKFSADLVTRWASHFPGQGVQLSGSGLIEKLFQISHDTMAALSHKPASRDPFRAGPRERLPQLLDVTAMLRTGNERFAPLLFHKISEALPRMTSPMVLNMPEGIGMDNSLATIDIFDGFGNAGMAQPPTNQMHFNFDPDELSRFAAASGGAAEYETKFQMPAAPVRMNSTGSPESNGCSNTSAAGANGGSVGGGTMGLATSPEASTSFATSPPLMSPSGDFAPGIGDMAFNDMIMPHLGGQSSGGGANAGHQPCGLPTLQSQSLNSQQLQPSIQGLPPGQAHAFGTAQQPHHHQQQQQQDMIARKSGQMPLTMHGMGQPVGGGGMAAQMPLPQGQRASAFVVGGHHGTPPIPRTVADFHALQRSFPQ